MHFVDNGLPCTKHLSLRYKSLVFKYGHSVDYFLQLKCEWKQCLYLLRQILEGLYSFLMFSFLVAWLGVELNKAQTGWNQGLQVSLYRQGGPVNRTITQSFCKNKYYASISLSNENNGVYL